LLEKALLVPLLAGGMSRREDKVKIAIAGAGMTGAYCYRLLKKDGFHVDLFDRPHKTACGISPCAWGTSQGFLDLIRAVRLLLENWEDPQEYTNAVLKEFDWMKKERAVIDKLLARSPLGIKEAWLLRKNSKRMGMQVGINEAFQFLKALKAIGS
jgi:glycine/D-amino acid oxidase-like deaminating enzyme